MYVYSVKQQQTILFLLTQYCTQFTSFITFRLKIQLQSSANNKISRNVQKNKNVVAHRILFTFRRKPFLQSNNLSRRQLPITPLLLSHKVGNPVNCFAMDLVRSWRTSRDSIVEIVVRKYWFRGCRQLLKYLWLFDSEFL